MARRTQIRAEPPNELNGAYNGASPDAESGTEAQLGTLGSRLNQILFFQMQEPVSNMTRQHSIISLCALISIIQYSSKR